MRRSIAFCICTRDPTWKRSWRASKHTSLPGVASCSTFRCRTVKTWRANPERSYGSPKIRHPTTGELVKYAERFEYDRLRQLLLIWMEFEPEGGGKPWKVPLTHRQFFPREVEALLHYNGFGEIFFTADFTDQPADQWVDSMVVSCRVAPAARPRKTSLVSRSKLLASGRTARTARTVKTAKKRKKRVQRA